MGRSPFTRCRRSGDQLPDCFERSYPEEAGQHMCRRDSNRCPGRSQHWKAGRAVEYDKLEGSWSRSRSATASLTFLTSASGAIRSTLLTETLSLGQSLTTNAPVRFQAIRRENRQGECHNAAMPLSMNREVFITCAVTGSGGTQDKSAHVPRSPEQIANSAIDAAKAGAAVVHCHVRHPVTGAPSRAVDLYREVTDRIRASEVDVVLNLTAGMGGDLVFGPAEQPLPFDSVETDMASAAERMEHAVQCVPEIVTLDCGTMNFAEADYVMTNTPGMLRAMGQMMTDLGVKPEIEAFDTGHLWFAKQLVNEGVLDAPAMVQLCMGVPWGAPNDMNTFMAMVNNIPESWTWSAFSLGRDQMPYVAAAILAGGNVRVGLEDNLFLERGVLASNAQLVERAVAVIEGMGAKVIGPDQVRSKLGLVKRAPVTS